MNTQIIAIANQKGGVGQSNAEVDASCAFARTAFLIDYGDHLGVHVFSSPYK